jgi:hypothetical protein
MGIDDAQKLCGPEAQDKIELPCGYPTTKSFVSCHMLPLFLDERTSKTTQSTSAFCLGGLHFVIPQLGLLAGFLVLCGLLSAH